jgi:hypothetical protein
MASRKVSRNDPCPCGSGKKFKHCCLGKGIDWSQRSTPTLPRLPPAPARVPDEVLRGPYARVDDRLKDLARSTPGAAPWKTAALGLSDRTPPEERVRAYQVVRQAGVLPADAGFFLLALPMEWLSADPAFSDLHRVEDEEVGRERWERAFQETIAGLLRRFGEPGMADLYLDNRLDYDRRYERGRQFYFGPPDEEYAKVLRERGVIE